MTAVFDAESIHVTSDVLKSKVKRLRMDAATSISISKNMLARMDIETGYIGPEGVNGVAALSNLSANDIFNGADRLAGPMPLSTDLFAHVYTKSN